MRRLRGFLLVSCVLLAGCSGGGGGGGGGSTTPPPPASLYVRASGNDDDTGTSPEHALRTVKRAVQLIAPGSTVVVGPGEYPGRIQIQNIENTEDLRLELIANPNGDLTGDLPGEVVLDAEGEGAALRIASSPFTTIDGFVITGSNTTGIRLLGASIGGIIRNCVINNGGGADGITVEDSSDPLIFNNLIFDNGHGILIEGSPGARIINNTIVDNRTTGITLREPDPNGAPSPGATVTNNIIQGNRNNISINVSNGPPSSLDGYAGDFNLAFAPELGDQSKTYRPNDTINGEHDINEDALFIDFTDGDFRLDGDSPAINAGTDAIDPDLRTALSERTTRATDERDSGPVDLGYHYLVPPTP